MPPVAQYPGALASLDQLSEGASGCGIVSVDIRGGVVRRMPLVVGIDGTLVPSFAIELLRVAQRSPLLTLTAAGASVTSVTAGALNIPTESDGAVRPHFSPHLANRFVSAIDLLDDKIGPDRLHERVVLIGLTALGLSDDVETPIGQRMSGTEVHAQLIENLIDGTLLVRPSWAPWVEYSPFACWGSSSYLACRACLRRGRSWPSLFAARSDCRGNVGIRIWRGACGFRTCHAGNSGAIRNDHELRLLLRARPPAAASPDEAREAA